MGLERVEMIEEDLDCADSRRRGLMSNCIYGSVRPLEEHNVLANFPRQMTHLTVLSWIV